jgi:PAS domain S-box-containing protein
VDNAATLQSALDQEPWDIVLSDHNMPGFSGTEALTIVRASGRDLPFIFVSGRMGESVAAEAMRAGAHDYMMKSNLKRLVPAVEREVREAQGRRKHRQVEEDLRVSNANMRQLLAVSPAVIYTLKMEGDKVVPVFVSENITELLGFPVKETLTYEWWLGQLHPEEKSVAVGSIAETTGSGKSRTEYRMRHKDGSYRWVDDQRRLILDDLNQPSELVGVWTDITERNQAEEALRRTANIVESSNDAIVSESLDGAVTSWNPAAETIFGYTAVEMIGKPLSVLLPPDRPLEEETILKRVNKGEGVFHFESQRIRKDGACIDTAITISAIKDVTGKIVGASKITRDISQRKQAELELEQRNDQLMGVSRQAAIAEFATSILHNVGNVLNSITVASSCLAESLRNSKTSNLSKVVGMMREHKDDLGNFFANDPKGIQVPSYLAELSEHLDREQSQALMELGQLQVNIDHIRSIVKMQQSSATVSGESELVKLAEVVEDALKLNTNALARGKIQIVRQYQDLPPVSVAKHKILQILLNLVRNSIQSLGETVSNDRRITLRVAETSEGVIVSVADNGKGISGENLPRIFTLGFTTKKDGHGFGLHSCAAIAKELGGHLTVESEGSSRGATFMLELPNRQQASSRAKNAEPQLAMA